MNSLFGTALRAVGAAIASTVRPSAWTNTRPAMPVVKSRAYDLDPYSEMEKGRMLEWWVLIADK